MRQVTTASMLRSTEVVTPSCASSLKIQQGLQNKWAARSASDA